jgi:transcriptional regulator with XRE-family HTH domain
MYTPATQDFPTLLRAYRERMGLSCNEVARAVGCDPSYVSRLERGEREPPRRRVVEALGLVLQLGIDEQDALLVSAGYAPATVALLGRWDPTLQAVAAVLTDGAVPDHDIERFRTVITTLATEWRARHVVPLRLIHEAVG